MCGLLVSVSVLRVLFSCVGIVLDDERGHKQMERMAEFFSLLFTVSFSVCDTPFAVYLVPTVYG